jgi:hypothetical protein
MHNFKTRVLRGLTTLALVSLFAGQGAALAAPTTAQVEPGAGNWPTWLLTSGSELRLAAPPAQAELDDVRAMAAQRDDATLDRISYWNAGAPPYRWTQRAVKYMEDHGIATNRAGRALALMNVAIYDATIAAWDTKYAYNRPRPSDLQPALAAVTPPASPSYPDEHATAAGAAATVLAYLFPADADMFRTWGDEASNSRVEAGVAYPTDVTAGLDLGRQVGERAADWGRADGSNVPWTGSVPTEPGKWTGTNPVEPGLGTWKPWALKSGSEFRPGPPPAPNSEQMAKEVAEVRDFPRTNLTNLIASFWEYYGGRASFEFWNDQISRSMYDYHLDANPPAAARVYATANAAYADTLIACWDAKYTYWAPRPAMVDPSIKTVFVTPNHPSYPAAHACVSGVFGSVLARYFPRDAQYFNGLADQAGEARIMGGIHFRSDLNAGWTLGRQVASVVWERSGSVAVQ